MCSHLATSIHWCYGEIAISATPGATTHRAHAKMITPISEHTDARPDLLFRNGETWKCGQKINPGKMAREAARAENPSPNA
jgi:hypothetical protein